MSVGPADVSVLVTTRDVARTLEPCLRSIRMQQGGVRELIVVDNHSTDATLEIARRYAHRVITAGPERSAQRNEAIRAASGTWVLWIDADMVLGPRVVHSALEVARREDVDAVAIPERTVGAGFWTACRALERSCYLDDPTLFNPRLLRRSLVLGVGGFDERMAGPEDTNLRLRLHERGVRVGHTDAMIDHDEGRLRLRDVARKRAYYGRSLPAFAAANPGAMRAQGASTAKAFLRHRRDLARRPLVAGGMIVLRTVEAAAYGYGYLTGRRTAAR